MCEYCNPCTELNETLYESKYVVCGRTDELELEVQNGKLLAYPTVNNWSEVFEFEINYCFNCGRNLKEQSNEL